MLSCCCSSWLAGTFVCLSVLLFPSYFITIFCCCIWRSSTATHPGTWTCAATLAKLWGTYSGLLNTARFGLQITALLGHAAPPHHAVAWSMSWNPVTDLLLWLLLDMVTLHAVFSTATVKHHTEA